MPSLAAALPYLPGASRVRRMIRRGEHALTLRFARRRNYVFTQFRRLPTQLSVLAGPVLEFLGVPGRDELRVIVFGCSIGAEPYSIAAMLRSRHPDLRALIECFDIEPAVIAKASTARYSRQEVESHRHVTAEFIAETFTESGDTLVIRPELRSCAWFSLGNVLDGRLIDRLGQADIVVAQNVLYHLQRADAERAFMNLTRLLAPRSALLVDGMDVDMRTRLTTAAGLRPCAAELGRIHDESRRERGYAWPRTYWGLEPFDPGRADATRRYATIFLRDP